MKVQSLDVLVIDSKGYSTRKLDIDMLRIVEAIETIPNYKKKFPLLKEIIEWDICERPRNLIPALCDELRKLPRIKQREGLESVTKNATRELLMVNEGEALRFATVYKEYSWIKVSFMFYCGDDDPQMVTDYVGLQPTKIAHKGIPVAARLAYWDLESDLSNDNDYVVEDHIKYLLSKCRPYKDKLATISKKYGGINVRIGVGFHASNPGFDFDSEVLQELAVYNASLSLDLYAEIDERD